MHDVKEALNKLAQAGAWATLRWSRLRSALRAKTLGCADVRLRRNFVVTASPNLSLCLAVSGGLRRVLHPARGFLQRFPNPSEDELRALLQRLHTVAIVGLSPQPARPSHRVAKALQALGLRIVPVRPAVDEVLGERAYARLTDIPFPVDLVDVFRAPEHVPALVEETIAIGAPAIWLQKGIVHEVAAVRARDAGLTVVMDRCLLRDYLKLMAG